MKLNTFFLFVLFLFLFVLFLYHQRVLLNWQPALPAQSWDLLYRSFYFFSPVHGDACTGTMSSPSSYRQGGNQPLETKGTSLDGEFLSIFFFINIRAFDATSRASCSGLAVPKGLMKESSIYSLWFDAQMKNLTHNNRSWSLINHILVFPYFQKQIPSSVF